MVDAAMGADAERFEPLVIVDQIGEPAKGERDVV